MKNVALATFLYSVVKFNYRKAHKPTSPLGLIGPIYEKRISEQKIDCFRP